MATWLGRLLHGERREEPAMAPEPAPAAAAAAAGAAAPAPGGNRRPLIDREGRLAGYEFRLGDALQARLQRLSDPIVQSAHAVAVLGSMRATVANGRVALFALPAAIATRPAVLAHVPRGAMLALSDGPWDAQGAASLAPLREAGALLGATGTPPPGGGFVLLEGAGAFAEAMEQRVRGLRESDPASKLVVTGLASIDDVEAALAHGVDWVAGAVDRGLVQTSSRALPAGLQRICQLLHRVMNDEELKSLSDELRTDIDLSYRLLRHANSPLLGLTRSADSIEQAVLLIGRDGLYRWLTVLLLVGADARPTSRALQEVALARARLLELLAPRIGAPPAALFTLGLLSLLEVTLRMPLAAAIEPLQLPEAATQALLQNAGPWWPALALAQGLEQQGSWDTQGLAREFGGLAAVQLLAEESWSWAAEAAGSLRRH